MPVFRWRIRARVESKSDMRNYHNPRGEGKLFNMELVDEEGAIKATAFNQEADKFYTLVQPGAISSPPVVATFTEADHPWAAVLQLKLPLGY